jgi:preprotein translocase SecE subunit
VARDRKRAKQRRVRRGTTAGGRVETAPPGGVPVRADVPGALGHASGDVDEFDAALVRGAGGVTATPDTDADSELERSNGDALATRDEIEAPAAAPPGGGGAGTGGGGAGGAGGGGDAERPSGAPLRGGNRVIGFLGASWAELQRVQWPDRRQVTQATAVVLGFVAIAGAYLGLADYVAKEIVELIL